MGSLGLYGEVFRGMRRHLGRLLFAVAAVAVSSALEILKPWPLKIVLDNVLRGVPFKNTWLAPLSPSSLLLVSCIGLVFLYTAIALFNVTNNYVTISIGQRMVNELRAQMFEHLQPLSLALHRRRAVFDLLLCFTYY